MPTLDWIGKHAVANHHREVPFHLLRSREDLSVGQPGSGNLLVQGDNLLALKALLPYYAGKVKCIYIDPPYNTGNENWVYNDNVNSPEIRDWLGSVVGTDDLTRHDKWLCMMYPRLQLLKEILTEDGVILISIDDFEVHDLRHILNEIFGPSNFIAELVWEKTRKNDAKLFSVGHEYLLVYARSLATLRARDTRWRESKPGADEIMMKYIELRDAHGDDHASIERELQQWYRSLPRSNPSKRLSRYKHVDAGGVWRDRDISWPGGGGPRYDVVHPVTGMPCSVPESGWRFATSDAMQDQIAKGLVQFREDHTKPPFRKAHLFPLAEEVLDTPEEADDSVEESAEDELVGAQVMPSVIYKQAQVAVKLLRQIFDGRKVFPNPKDHEVLMRLIKYVTSPGDIVLDAFAGSASTGHAVLQLNAPGGRRSFILIEMDEAIFSNVTTERLKRVINGYSYGPADRRKRVDPLGGGFAVCELGETLFDPTGHIRADVDYVQLARHVFFVETGEPLPMWENPRWPLLGVANGTGVYLLFNGILKDKSSNGGNVLTRAVLDSLPSHDGPMVVYGTGCRISEQRLRELSISFRQIPYQIRTA